MTVKKYLGMQSNTLFTVLGFASIPLLGVMDYLTGVNISFSIFYLLPISAVTQFAGKKAGILVSIASAAVFLLVDLLGSVYYVNPVIHLWNVIVRLGFFLFVVFFLSANKTLKQRLETKVEERTATLAQEITDHKRAEKALRESEEKYRELVERSNDGIVIIQDTIVKYANRGFLRMWGGTETELIGTPATNLVHSDELSKVVALYEKRVAGENVMPIYDTAILRKNGDTAHVGINAGRIKFQNKPADFVIIHDNTDHKQLLETLRESEERYRALSDRSLDLVYVHDLEGKFIDANIAAMTLFGYGKKEISSLNLISLLTENQYPLAFRTFKELTLKGYQKKTTEYMLKCKNGEFVYVETKSCVIYRGGKPYAILGIGREVGERKKMENQIRTDLKEKEVLLKEVHHRVKNNMQVVISLLSLQSREIKDPKVLAKFKESQNRIHSMALVHEMLYKSETLSKIDFGEYVRNLINNLLHSYDEDRRDIHLDLDLEPVSMSIDESIPCGMIIQELFSNAMKHAFPDQRDIGPVVRIGLHRRDSAVELTVADNGVGIQKKVDLKKPETLGLNLVAILGEQIQADIKLDQTKGTEFRIRFKIKG